TEVPLDLVHVGALNQQILVFGADADRLIIISDGTIRIAFPEIRSCARAECIGIGRSPSGYLTVAEGESRTFLSTLLTIAISGRRVMGMVQLDRDGKVGDRAVIISFPVVGGAAAKIGIAASFVEFDASVEVRDGTIELARFEIRVTAGVADIFV